MYWVTNHGIEFNITKKQARDGYHQGDCEESVKDLSDVKAIRKQLDKIDPETLKDELREYGAWEEEELLDHEQNLQRILWLVCADIIEDSYQ